MKELSIDDIRDRIVFSKKIAHVTFYIVNDAMDITEDCYRVYSKNVKRGICLVSDSFEYQQLNSGSLDDARAILDQEIQKLEETLEDKRDGVPTEKQVYFLFQHKIPIPIDLTWGDASDLIDEHLAQIAKDKQTRRLERFHGFTEGDKVSFTIGKETIRGCITKLYQAGGGAYMLIVAEGIQYRLQKFDNIHKIKSDITFDLHT